MSDVRQEMKDNVEVFGDLREGIELYRERMMKSSRRRIVITFTDEENN